MKRHLAVYAASSLVSVWLLAASCSNPLEVNSPTSPEPIDATDSVLLIDTLTLCDTVYVSDSAVQVDTVVVTDSMYFTDTIYVADTIRYTDTLLVTDSVVIADTIRYTDTLIVTDSVVIADTIRYTDTLLVTDSVVIADTIRYTDTLLVTDSVVIADTIRYTDTLLVTDSVVIADTVFAVDTLVRVDTVMVTNPADCPGFCSQLNSSQKEIVWMLFNSAGRHRLDFSAFVERGKPLQTLIVTVGDREYRWSPADGDEYSIEVDLGEHADVRLSLDNPQALGHSIDVCLEVTPL